MKIDDFMKDPDNEILNEYGEVKNYKKVTLNIPLLS